MKGYALNIHIKLNTFGVVFEGFLPILANMLKETDLYIRQQLALCFKYCAGMVPTMVSSRICELNYQSH